MLTNSWYICVGQDHYPALPWRLSGCNRVVDGNCRQTRQLVSHGFLYKKQVGAEAAAIGKRVFCSNRNRRTGCGRTMRLYLDATVRYLHYAGEHVIAFVLALMVGMTVQCAYCQATGSADARHAYRWLHRLCLCLSDYRSLLHPLPIRDNASPIAVSRSASVGLLASTFRSLLQQFGQPLCARYQGCMQRAFL